jgi:hypothetical protein
MKLSFNSSKDQGWGNGVEGWIKDKNGTVLSGWIWPRNGPISEQVINIPSGGVSGPFTIGGNYYKGMSVNISGGSATVTGY